MTQTSVTQTPLEGAMLKWWRGTSLILAVLITITLSSAALQASAHPGIDTMLYTKQMGIISHRGGASSAPENTLAAITSGIEQGADFIEVDIRLTRDRVPILMHDSSVDRTTNGAGKVRSLMWNEIRDLDAGSWHSPQFAGEPIPTFYDFIDELAPTSGKAFVELKGVWAEEDLIAIVEELEAHKLAGRIVLTSFEEDHVREFARLAPEFARVLLVRSFTEDTLKLASELGVLGVGARLQLFEEEPELVQRMRDEGVGVFAYTLNDPEEWERARTAGMDLIVTDDGLGLQDWLVT